MITRALYYKYASSQNYYYSKEITNYLTTPSDIQTKTKIINF